MEGNGPNHPFVVWASNFLWLISVFFITWSLLLLFCVSDLLFLTGTDLVNAIVLFSGVIMLPTNIFILNHIAKGKKIDVRLRVLCCPLWQCIIWIIIINFIGVVLCMHRIYVCQDIVTSFFSNSMKNYRAYPKYKRFIDYLQLSLQCCGLKSYKDWFKHDWHDKVREYDLEPPMDTVNVELKKDENDVDSVPLSEAEYYVVLSASLSKVQTFNSSVNRQTLTTAWLTFLSSLISCCKSGSCVSSYLEELGTNSINTNGCGNLMYRLIIISMNIHLVFFVTVILLEILILRYALLHSSDNNSTYRKIINHIMPVNEHFDVSSGSCHFNAEDSEDGNVYEKKNMNQSND